MQITFTLSEPIVNLLQQKADRLNVSFEEFIEKIFRDAAADLSRENVLASDHDEPLPSLEEVVAMIKATPPNLDAIEPATQTIDEFLVELEADPPEPSDITPDEWDKLWAEFELDLKERDLAQDMAEGRF
ncbi:MAG: hypothetical protein AAF702_00465 [Chloroflexota bacterium]